MWILSSINWPEIRLKEHRMPILNSIQEKESMLRPLTDTSKSESPKTVKAAWENLKDTI